MSKRNDTVAKLLDLLFEYCNKNACPTCGCDPSAPHEHYCTLADVVQDDARGRPWQRRWYWHTWRIFCTWCRRGLIARHLLTNPQSCRYCGEDQWRLGANEPGPVRPTQPIPPPPPPPRVPPDEIRGDDG